MNEEPREYRCPLSGKLMEFPVTASDDVTYEWSNIQDWFELGYTISPVFKTPLPHFKLIYNQSLKWEIEKYKGLRNSQYFPFSPISNFPQQTFPVAPKQTMFPPAPLWAMFTPPIQQNFAHPHQASFPPSQISFPHVRKEEAGPDIDFKGYVKAKRATISSYDPVIPAPSNTFQSKSKIPLNLYSITKRLNVSRLLQTDIEEVLNGNYPRQEPYEHDSFQEIVSIENVVRNIESNIVAISIGKGEPVGTGFLITNNLVLTARHCIEEIPLNKITVKENYQSVSGYMDFGVSHNVLGWVDQNPKLDYVILYLASPVQRFCPCKFYLGEDDFSGESLFFHHPQGGPKKVSVHETPQSNYFQLTHNSFHDSEKGSSGGVYVNADSKVFALHTLHDGQATSARYLREIYEASPFLRELCQNVEPINPSSYHTEILRVSWFSNEYQKWLERVNRPNTLPNLNVPGQLDLSYHHIIPIGDMEFLWMLGKENQAIEGLLRYLCRPEPYWQKEPLVINEVAWIPCNLLIGPTDRSDDAKKSDLKEPIKPLSFPEGLWEALTLLYEEIQHCWDLRQQLNGTIRNRNINGAIQALKAFRKQTVDFLDTREDQNNLGAVGMFGRQNPIHNRKSILRDYQQAQKDLAQGLRKLINENQKRKAPHSAHAYQGHEADWEQCYDDNGQVKYKLKTTPVMYSSPSSRR